MALPGFANCGEIKINVLLSHQLSWQKSYGVGVYALLYLSEGAVESWCVT